MEVTSFVEGADVYVKARMDFFNKSCAGFLCIAQNDHITAREIAGIVGITERAVQRINDF